ncbi:MAG: UDP-glucose 4-epimerase GalE [Crocinitomicaceae bacterium]|nr:UDP-glucose 4-epimerase GalE [Crocinitomicaceae bacterium]
MKKILVTGGAGYIGSHTVVQLIQNGYNPIVVDDFRNSQPAVIQNLEKITNQSIPFYAIDICDKTALNNVLKNTEIEGIIHFAAYKAVGESVEKPLMYYHNNVEGLINVLDWALNNNVKHFIFSSSCTVYGEPQGIKEVSEETASGIANSPYGQTKVIGEQILNDVKHSGVDLNILALRYFNPIGAHASGLIGELPVGKPNNLLPFITQTAAGLHKELTVFGNDYPTSDGTCVRDYIHVVDLAEAHVKGIDFLAQNQPKSVEFINVGTGKGTSVLEMIQTFEETTGKKLNWKFGPRREGDVVEIYANADKSREKLGWIAQYSIKDAINDAWNWEKNIRNI